MNYVLLLLQHVFIQKGAFGNNNIEVCVPYLSRRIDLRFLNDCARHAMLSSSSGSVSRLRTDTQTLRRYIRRSTRGRPKLTRAARLLPEAFQTDTLLQSFDEQQRGARADAVRQPGEEKRGAFTKEHF